MSKQWGNSGHDTTFLLSDDSWKVSKDRSMIQTSLDCQVNGDLLCVQWQREYNLVLHQNFCLRVVYMDTHESIYCQSYSERWMLPHVLYELYSSHSACNVWLYSFLKMNPSFLIRCCLISKRVNNIHLGHSDQIKKVQGEQFKSFLRRSKGLFQIEAMWK